MEELEEIGVDVAFEAEARCNADCVGALLSPRRFGVLVDSLQSDIDTTLLELSLKELEEGDELVAIGLPRIGHLDVQSVRITGSGQKLTRLRGVVAHHLPDLRLTKRIGEGAGQSPIALSTQETLGVLIPVDTERDRLANPKVVERLVPGVNPDMSGFGITERVLNGAWVIALELLRWVEADPPGQAASKHVKLFAAERGCRRGVVLDDQPADFVDVWLA